MGLTLTPEPCITTGSGIQITVAKSPDIDSYAVTTDGTPPVLAKYIAYDNLVPQNPFIATVEDGLGKVLMDGGFPKWYNINHSSTWTQYSDLAPSFKYMFDAIKFLANSAKVDAGNKKILVLGDVNSGAHYNVYDRQDETIAGSYCFRNSIEKVCSIGGWIPTFKTPNSYGTQLDPTYNELDQYAMLIFIGGNYTNVKLFTDSAIANIVTFRQSGNGLFIITDHGDRSMPDLNFARTGDYSGFYRAANQIVTNFGCYFSGNYDRSPVNVGFLRANYGNHPLWANLTDADNIQAGGSESRIFVTSFPLNYGSINLSLTNTGYSPVQFLIRYTDGSVKLESYTYGLNVPEIIFPLNDQDTEFSNSVIYTVKDTFYINFKINHTVNCSGLIKLNTTVIGNFNYIKATETTDINLNSNYTIALYQTLARNVNVKNTNSIYIQMITPISYTKTLTIDFPVIKFEDLKFSKYLVKGYIREFTAPTYSTSFIRNFKRVILNKDLRWWLKFDDLRFKSRIFKSYFERNGDSSGALNNILTPVGGDSTGSQLLFKTYNFGTGVANAPIQFSFDFIEIQSWDGELFKVYANDTLIAQKNFWVDSFYGNLDVDGKPNLNSVNPAWPDEVHTFVLDSNTDASGKFKLGFGSTVNDSISNESFTVDNIKMLVRYSSENFTNDSNGWNLTVWDSQGAGKMLGLMGGTSGTEGYSKLYQFGQTNANRKAKISLQFYKVDSWDGEFFIIFVNGVTVYRKSFVGTSYGNSDPSETGTTVSLGASSASWNFEEYFNLSFEAYTDNNGDLRLGFGNTLDQPTWDEAAAVDNITIDLIFTEDFESGSNGWNTDTTGYSLSI